MAGRLAPYRLKASVTVKARIARVLGRPEEVMRLCTPPWPRLAPPPIRIPMPPMTHDRCRCQGVAGLTMYLVATPGPTSFVVKEPSPNSSSSSSSSSAAASDAGSAAEGEEENASSSAGRSEEDRVYRWLPAPLIPLQCHTFHP